MNDPSHPLPISPIAATRSVIRPWHGIPREDPYAWMEELDSPAMTAHLTAERVHADAVMGAARITPDALFQEMRARMPEAEQQVPVSWGGYLYYSRFSPGLAHAIHCRRRKPDGAEEILLDENALVAIHHCVGVAALSVSPDHRHLLFALDGGDERCTLFVKDLVGGNMLPEMIHEAGCEVAWIDGACFLYLGLDGTGRPARVHCHRLGGAVAADTLLYAEADSGFHLSLRRSESGRFVFVTAQSLQSSEIWCLSCHDPAGTGLLPVSPRVPGREVYATDQGDHLYLLTNEDAPNFKLVRMPLPVKPGVSRMTVETVVSRMTVETVVPHRPDVRLRHIEAFARHLVLHQRVDGVPQLRIIAGNGDGSDQHSIALPEPFYTLHLGDNREYDSAVLRFGYDSFITPYCVHDYDMDRRQLTARHVGTVPGYDPALYSAVRFHVPAGDGSHIPVSLVYHRERCAEPGPRPLLLYAYGAYGHSVETEFSAARLSLLDRGVIFAVAHVRGGGELGHDWHKAGCRRNKPRAVEDLIACAEYLIGLRLTDADRLGVMGQSAGGLIATAAMNRRPDLFAAVVADVPFLDPIGTLSDARQPYTALDREEWGNPEDPEDYAVLASYAPYDTVRPAAYPPVLLTAGFHDVHVGCWEPAKMAARLRAASTNGRPVLLRIRMQAGHDGPLDRYDELREWAYIHAFVLQYLCSTATPARMS